MSKTYRDFIVESKKKASRPNIVPDENGYFSYQTFHGGHAMPKAERAAKKKEDSYSTFSTVFGKHSQPKDVKEVFEYDKSPAGTGAKPSNDFKPFSMHGMHNSSQDIKNHAFHVKIHSEQLENHYKKHTPDHVNAIRRYTEDSSELNGALIDRHKYKIKSPPPDHVDHIAHLDSAVKAHKTPRDIQVFSGTKHSPENYPVNKETGKIHLHMPAYTSTSIDPQTATGFSKKDHDIGPRAQHNGRHLLHIHVPEGSHGSYIEHHTSMYGEHEFLLPRNSKLHVHPEPETHISKGYDGQEHKVHVWKAHLQPHEDH